MARGICWSTTDNPTIYSSNAADGTGTGAFTSTITGLTANTVYHVRAYATNSVGTGYGNDLTFTSLPNPVIPTLTTTPLTAIAQTVATGGGDVTADGGASITARGVCWSATVIPTTANSKTIDVAGAGKFTSTITGLTANTAYHVRAYATNSVGTSYGSDVSFTTLPAGSGSWQTNGSNIYYSSGNIGIGTANPSQALTVRGKILATEVEVVSSIAADYVFDAEYELMPLTELELYLKQNKHLPNIPSATEFSEQGQNLGKMDDMLLRKIEELTLYIIQQDQKMKKQDEVIGELEKR